MVILKEYESILENAKKEVTKILIESKKNLVSTLQMMDKLKTGGVLSISLPTDPGLLFRLGRFYLKTFSINLILLEKV